MCLGKGLAMLEIKLGLAMILDVFETPVPKWEGKVIHGYTRLYMKHMLALLVL